MQYLISLDPASGASLQQQLRQQIANAILDGFVPPDQPLPSSRKLASELQIGRNTVMLAYDQLVDDGFLVARQRSGYFVNPQVLVAAVDETPGDLPQAPAPAGWSRWIRPRPSELVSISKPDDWQSYPHPFIYGQIDESLFPTRQWRECWRDAVSVSAINAWSGDHVDRDDPALVEQIRTRLLPRRGVRVGADEILVTVGAQHALYLAMQLLLNVKRTLGVENPGYVDARNIASLNHAQIRALDVDEHGMVVDAVLVGCDCVYVTPSHQSPTTVTMPRERRQALLDMARTEDFLVIEDDYETETRFEERPEPALKSLDRDDRVIYVGSLSKTLAPGLRMGYLVAPADFIREARALRRLMLRHPASNNQRAIALFLERGYHDALLGKLRKTYQQRAGQLRAAIATWLPDYRVMPGTGGSSLWIEGPSTLDSRQLAALAASRGVLIEPGDVFFYQAEPPRNCFRLGYSSIADAAIEPGIRLLAEAAAELAAAATA